jgi:2-polyprenyl-3-methyl-5-hydroxy-6-metoxy-1,4-benzoquinol methylase
MIKLEQKVNNILIKKDYDKRLVNYEVIHQVKDKDYDRLNLICDLKDGDVIMDYGAGYGSVTTELIKRNNTLDLSFTLLEPSEVQINRAETLVGSHHNKQKVIYVNSALSEVIFAKESFTHIISKVAIHEIPFSEQESELRTMYDILQNNGSVYVWTINCDKELQHFVQSFFRKKDSLTNLKSLAKNRYFANSDELILMLNNSGFKTENITIHEILPMTYETKNQLDQDFKGNFKKLKLFNDYIRKSVKNESEYNKEKLRFIDDGNTVTVHIPQFIIKATKLKTKQNENT